MSNKKDIAIYKCTLTHDGQKLIADIIVCLYLYLSVYSYLFSAMCLQLIGFFSSRCDAHTHYARALSTGVRHYPYLFIFSFWVLAMCSYVFIYSYVSWVFVLVYRYLLLVLYL